MRGRLRRRRDRIGNAVARPSLQSAKLIRYRRGHIQILDRKALEDIACECYAVVRQNADKMFIALRSSS